MLREAEYAEIILALAGQPMTNVGLGEALGQKPHLVQYKIRSLHKAGYIAYVGCTANPRGIGLHRTLWAATAEGIESLTAEITLERLRPKPKPRKPRKLA